MGYGRQKWHSGLQLLAAILNVPFRPNRLLNFEKNGAHHFSLIGRHLESVGRTEPVFELNLALSEKRPTNECRSDSGIFLSSYRVTVISCNLWARAKVPGHRELK